MNRRTALAALSLLPAAVAHAFPERPIRFVLGFPAGAAPDLIARLLADALRESWPAGVMVENRTGAGGQVAAQAVAKSTPPDGYGLLFGEVGQLAMAPSTFARLPYDPARDFTAVAEVAAIEFALVVPPGVPADSVAGFAAWARSQPRLGFATFGAGTPGHFAAALLAAELGLPADPVHFRATGEAVGAVLNGTVPAMFGTVALVAPHVREGRLKALATTGAVRARLLPAVPTMAELGKPALTIEAWFGLVAPSATPEPALATLETAVLRALGGESVRARVAEAGFRVTALGREAFAQRLREETARWAGIVRATGFQALD